MNKTLFITAIIFSIYLLLITFVTTGRMVSMIATMLAPKEKIQYLLPSILLVATLV